MTDGPSSAWSADLAFAEAALEAARVALEAKRVVLHRAMQEFDAAFAEKVACTKRVRDAQKRSGTA